MRMTPRYRTSRGFTLIESVMVIVIIGVISAVVAVPVTCAAHNAGSNAP